MLNQIIRKQSPLIRLSPFHLPRLRKITFIFAQNRPCQPLYIVLSKITAFKGRAANSCRSIFHRVRKPWSFSSFAAAQCNCDCVSVPTPTARLCECRRTSLSELWDTKSGKPLFHNRAVAANAELQQLLTARLAVGDDFGGFGMRVDLKVDLNGGMIYNKGGPTF
ncbi:hypothetical protein Acr_21g0004210 [Actinidia rufa]|uniref:Uncharacterized protein n=1 Tax=Actinidia rufa TaxID=165716 RepID=A0A7J0GGG2_9ERIC|nr:hypothetical protein Acr_21g0004210 [Actinidia rufa]